jgi:hypothetical protein
VGSRSFCRFFIFVQKNCISTLFLHVKPDGSRDETDRGGVGEGGWGGWGGVGVGGGGGRGVKLKILSRNIFKAAPVF